MLSVINFTDSFLKQWTVSVLPSIEILGQDMKNEIGLREKKTFLL